MRRRRRDQSGFALLLVFLMAAMIAITMYLEIPRVAFDAQRQKEDLLIYRGEQYKRAIEVFMRANKRYPAKIEDLESTNNRHYLRRRYIDPMTGKDEWRAVHTNGMTLTDSKVQTQQQKDQNKDKDTTAGQYVGIVAGLGQTIQPNSGQPSAPGGNLANRRRESDNRPNPAMGGGNPGDPNAPPGSGNMANNAPGMPPMPGQPVQPGQNPLPNFPGMPPGVLPGQPRPGQTGMPGTAPGATGNPGTNTNASGGSSYLGGGSSYLGGGGSYLGGSATPTPPSGNMPPTGQPGPPQPGFPPGTPVNSQTGGVSAMPGSPYPTQAGAAGSPAGFQQPGIAMNPQAQGAAQNMINNLLTQPRPGGMPMTNTGGMQTMGGGIAGFASTVDQDSIMVYNDQTNYGLWEFVFDPMKVKPIPNPNTGPVGTPASQIGNQIGTPANQVGQPAGQNPFGGNQSPFGQNPMGPPTGRQ